VRYPGIVKGLAAMPDETVLDGELVALDQEGNPSVNTLQIAHLRLPRFTFMSLT
jgi:hypothetical protein